MTLLNSGRSRQGYCRRRRALLGKAERRAVVSPGMENQQPLGQPGQILRAVAERRDLDLDDVETVEQVSRSGRLDGLSRSMFVP